eukprot:SAG11_NODE_5153_length_1645_cov_68.153299_1_plen_144_part_00
MSDDELLVDFHELLLVDLHEPEPEPEPEPEEGDKDYFDVEIPLISSPFFLASCPVRYIDQAIVSSLKFGGEYSAGDATDKLNKDILDPANEAWKTAWKGKTSQAYRMLKRIHRNEKIITVAIAGGPACDWERDELTNNFIKNI